MDSISIQADQASAATRRRLVMRSAGWRPQAAYRPVLAPVAVCAPSGHESAVRRSPQGGYRLLGDRHVVMTAGTNDQIIGFTIADHKFSIRLGPPLSPSV